MQQGPQAQDSQDYATAEDADHNGFIALPDPAALPTLSSASSIPTLTTPIMRGNSQFQTALVTPQLPPPPAVTPSVPTRQTSSNSLEGRRMTLITGQELTDVRKNLAIEQKTPAEYTLHILFTQFVRHAERKLNLCLNNYSLDTEPPIVDLLSEGADPEFDTIIESLGHIAKRKPKSVIDSVMFWRKSKSEVSMLAAAAVETHSKSLQAERKRRQAEVLSHNGSSSTLTASTDARANTQLPPQQRGLYRQASLSFMKGHKNSSSKATLATEKTSSSIERQVSRNTSIIDAKIGELEAKLEEAKITAIQGERKSLISIYILCRVLIAVVRQTPTDTLGDDLADKLEEIIYTQLKTSDPLLVSESLIRSSNWNLFAVLLGHMSERRFLQVSDRFIADLEKVPATVIDGRPNYVVNDSKIALVSIFNESGSDEYVEESLSLLIHGMRYLTLTHYPLENFEESADFLQSIGKFYQKSDTESIIVAYSVVLNQLLLPLAGVITAEVNHPQWREAINLIYQKAFRILKQGPDQYWECGLSLLTTVLTVSPNEIFLNNWINLIEANAVVLKPKVSVDDKILFITCFARLLWVYLYRCTESLNSTHRTLDTLFNLLFFKNMINKKQQSWLTSDQPLIAMLVYLIRIAGYSSVNYTLENILLPLIRIGYFAPGLEGISPSYLILVIRAYVCILSDYESKERPKFPSEDLVDNCYHEKASANPAILASQQPVFQKDTSNAALSEEISNTFQVVFLLLDKSVGAPSWQMDDHAMGNINGATNNSAASPLSPFSSKSPLYTFLHGKDVQYAATKTQHVELFAILIEASPFISDNIGAKSLIETLVRNAVHSDSRVSSNAVNALKVLVMRKNPRLLVTVFARYAFQLDDNPKQAVGLGFLSSAEYTKLLRIYVDLLLCWLNSLRIKLKVLQQQEEHDTPQPINGHPLADTLSNANPSDSTQKIKISDELELKNIITIIEEVEGNGLFFLCSQNSIIRGLGLHILRIIAQFDEVIYDISTSNNPESQKAANSSDSPKKHRRYQSKFAAEFGTRLIQVLESIDIYELISPLEDQLSFPEKSRLKEFRAKRKKNVLTYIAKSDYGIDSTLWFKIFPKLLRIIFEKCVMPIALCRSVVCIRLVQMYDAIFEFANSVTTGKTTHTISHHPSNSASSFFSSTSSDMRASTTATKFNLSSHPPELLVEQWRIYLIFACSTLTSTGDQRMHIPSSSISSTGSSGFTKSHARKKSHQVFTVQYQKITSAKSIFKMVIPLLGTQQVIVRDAVVACLSSVNANILRTFVESIIPIMESWSSQSRAGSQWDDKVRIEVARVLNNVTFGFLQNSVNYVDDWILTNLVTSIKHLKSFLSSSNAQLNFEYQRLHRYFAGILENVFVAVLNTEDPEKWFPFEARISCFKFLEEWCGYGKYASLTDSRYKEIKKRISSSKDTISASATIELERSALELASISCMATICSCPISKGIQEDETSAVMSFDTQGLLEWIHALFESSNTKANMAGRKALFNILTVNTGNTEIYEDIIDQCYVSSNTPKTRETYFLTLTDSLMKLESIPIKAYQLLALCFYALSNDRQYIRVTAVKLLKWAEKMIYDSSNVDQLTERLCSSSKSVYKSGPFHVASIFSSDVQVISELCRVFHIVEAPKRREVLSALLPFFSSIELPNDDSAATDETTQMVFRNLLEITMKYSDMMPHEVEGLWVALGNGNNAANVGPIMSFITKNCLERRNPNLVEISRQVVVYLSNTPAAPAIINELISNLQPRNMVPPQQVSSSDEFNAKQMPYIADLWDVLAYSGKESIFSLGQLSIIFLADLFISPPEAAQTNLPLLLHVSFVLLDHYIPLVQDVALEMLTHLVNQLAGDHAKGAETAETLRKRNQKSLWIYDDLNSDKNGARTPSTMDVLIRNVLESLGSKFPMLQEEWSRVSLTWATTCAVRHIACRSFQVFRSLLSFLDQGMLRDMLHRLSNTISDETPDIRGFAMQILMTLNAIAAELDSAQLISFPQLFWSSVACLSSVHEAEYIETLSTLSKFVSKIDLDSEMTVSCLTTTFPPKWEGKFDGLQQIVMIGLRSSDSWDHSLKLLDRLNKLHDSQIIGSGDSRIMLALLSNLPRYLHALTSDDYTIEVLDSAETVCQMIDRASATGAPEEDRSGLKRILESFIKKRFRTKQDFLNETVNKIVLYFFPTYQAQTLVFLLGILSNSIKWVKVETMEILEKVMPRVDLQKEEFIGVGADLISPLLRLLLTDYAEQALKVLDQAVSISGSQLDKDVLRMSLGNKSIRKEYEKTATLFGIPDESGWAIPMPAVTAATTRNNVHAVFSTCSSATNNTEAELLTNTANVEFHREEYTSAKDHGEPLSAVESHQQQSVAQQDSSLSHIYAALVNLDSFFGDESETNTLPGHSGVSHRYTSSVDTKESLLEPIIPFESAPQIYDKKVSVILNRSLARTPSNASFKTSLADSFGSSPSGLTEQYISRDASNYTLSQRASAMSFMSHRNSSRRQALDPSLSASSVTDLTKTEEKPQHRTPPMSSAPSKDLSSPFLYTDQRDHIHTQSINAAPLNSAQESTFKLEGILRGSNKTKRKSGKAQSAHSNLNTPASSTSNGSQTDLSGTQQTLEHPSTPQGSGANGSNKAKERSSVFSRGNKKNPSRASQVRT